MQAFRSWIFAMRRPRMGRRIVAMVLSIATMGFCVCMFHLLSSGTDPYSTMCFGLEGKTGIVAGTWMTIINALLLVVVLLCNPNRIGLGTLCNMMGVGIFTELFRSLFRNAGIEAMSLLSRSLLFVPVVVLFLLVVALYMAADLGVSPYDAIPMLVVERNAKIPYKWARIALDMTGLLIGFLLGATLGPTTVIVAFFMGPMAQWVAEKVKPFFQ